MSRWLDLPFVIYAHGNEILEVLGNEWPKPRLALHKANRVLAVSHFTADWVRKLGVADSKIEIVHPGCDINSFRPVDPKIDFRQRLLGSSSGDHVILTVGNLVPRKGHDLVIRALPKLLSSGFHVSYLIVGDGPHRSTLERLAQEIGVSSRVIFAGRLAYEDLPQVYAMSDVFVMPSREQQELHDVEGFGMVFLEANACGKPVIGGRSGGVGDAILDGVTGLLVDPIDVDDIAKAIKCVLSNAEFAKQLGDQGRLRVLNEFCWQRVGERVRNILYSIWQEKQMSRTGMWARDKEN
jgi:phosphatidylinositol alpha-1,6-mannosyltransferase